MSRLPNFLIIGAAKGGTTSLYHYLNQHPQVYMSPVKEPRFFALEGDRLNFQNPDNAINQTSITTLSEYYNLFQGVTDEIAIGEASPIYMYSSKAVQRIVHYVPTAKFIAILRNPVDRAYSCYKHLIALETYSFADALQHEDTRIRQNWAHLWHYRQGGYYYAQLKRYYETFDKKQIKVLLFDDLKSQPLAVIQDAFSFIGVDNSYIPELAHQNVSNNPRVKFLQNLFNGKNKIRSAAKYLFPEILRRKVALKVRSWNSKEFLPMTEEVRCQLIDGYRDDIVKLQDLIDCDLSHWMN